MTLASPMYGSLHVIKEDFETLPITSSHNKLFPGRCRIDSWSAITRPNLYLQYHNTRSRSLMSSISLSSQSRGNDLPMVGPQQLRNQCLDSRPLRRSQKVRPLLAYLDPQTDMVNGAMSSEVPASRVPALSSHV